MAGRGGEDSGRSPATPYRAIGEKGARFLTDFCAWWLDDQGSDQADDEAH